MCIKYHTVCRRKQKIEEHAVNILIKYVLSERFLLQTQPELAVVQKKKTKKKKQEVRAYAFVSEYILHFL